MRTSLLPLSALAAVLMLAISIPAGAQAVPPLYTPGRTYNISDHIVSTSVFCWYAPYDGQQSGPWRPLEGRPNWTGESAWWQGQIKQIMMANIDVMWVHLVEDWDSQRTNLFLALNQLRSQGYDVPKVAPFFDAPITWNGLPVVDLATTAGKDEFARHYIRFFQQYYSVNQDAQADTYIQQIDGKVVLDTWHLHWLVSNISSLTRGDVEARLAAAFGAAHPCFNSGIRMVTTAYNLPTVSFADEKVPQFEVTAYSRATTFNGVKTVQLKAGYWDQNVRTPGSILTRGGGGSYRTAWNSVDRTTTTRAYIESWNEYDEGSGIYAANTGSPYRVPTNTSTDVWSTTNDPYEYIRTTATGAAAFNDTPTLGAKVLWHNIPSRVRIGTTTSVKMIMRNEGDTPWTGATGVTFGQDRAADPAIFCASDCTINDSTNEIPTYGGIFRGRPIEFSFLLTAPTATGTFLTHWGMTKSGVGRFGEQSPVSIEVAPPVPTPSAPTDAGFATRYSVRFDWTAVVDPISGTAGYNCRIGTTPGGSDIFSGYLGNVLSRSIVGSNAKTYYCQVQAVANDGCTSPWSPSSDGIIFDSVAPPAPGTPTDSGFYTQNTTITFSWTPAVDAASGTVDYACRIGTTPGGNDIFSGYVGNTTSKSISVTPGHTYYCRVIAKDAAGNTANWSGVSDGVGVVHAADEPIGLAKAHPNGTWVGLTLPVSAAFSSMFYIQDTDGASGIAVSSPQLCQPGSIMRVYGSLGTVNEERVIYAEKAQGL